VASTVWVACRLNADEELPKDSRAPSEVHSHRDSAGAGRGARGGTLLGDCYSHCSSRLSSLLCHSCPCAGSSRFLLHSAAPLTAAPLLVAGPAPGCFFHALLLVSPVRLVLFLVWRQARTCSPRRCWAGEMAAVVKVEVVEGSDLIVADKGVSKPPLPLPVRCVSPGVRSDGVTGWRVAGGGWRVAGGGWRVAGGGWRVAGGGWRVAGGGWRVAGGGWRVAGGGWRVAGGGWRVAGGGWRVAGGGWRVAGDG